MLGLNGIAMDAVTMAVVLLGCGFIGFLFAPLGLGGGLLFAPLPVSYTHLTLPTKA